MRIPGESLPPAALYAALDVWNRSSADSATMLLAVEAAVRVALQEAAPPPQPGTATVNADDLDWLTAASDPRVVAVVLAQLTQRWQMPTVQAGALSDYLRMVGITATEDQARALLDAVAARDEVCADTNCRGPEGCAVAARLTAAVTAIVGERP